MSSRFFWSLHESNHAAVRPSLAIASELLPSGKHPRARPSWMNHSATIPTAAEFCGDDELGYQRSRTRFAAGAGLALDEAYRLAHLPLVAPAHPRVIRTRAGTSYQNGRHERVYSLVLPVTAEALERSQAYRELERDMRALPLSRKIAWDIVEARREKLHATIAGS